MGPVEVLVLCSSLCSCSYVSNFFVEERRLTSEDFGQVEFFLILDSIFSAMFSSKDE